MKVQIFGIKGSAATRAAERFFKERRASIHLVDLSARAISAGELRRFEQKFGLNELLDIGGRAYADAGLEWMRVSDGAMLARIEAEPRLLRLPLVRSGNRLSVGPAEAEWRAWYEQDRLAD